MHEVARAFVAVHRIHSTDMDALLRVQAAEVRDETMSAGALKRELRLTTGAITAVVDRLERAGALSRARDHDDRRKVLLTTTTRGRALADEYSEPVRSRIDEVLAGFDAEQLEIVGRHLRATADAMAAHRHRLTSPRETAGPLPDDPEP